MRLNNILGRAWADRMNTMLGATPMLRDGVGVCQPFQVEGSSATYSVEAVQTDTNLFDVSLRFSDATGLCTPDLKWPLYRGLCGGLPFSKLVEHEDHVLISRYNNTPRRIYKQWAEVLVRQLAHAAHVPIEDPVALAEEITLAHGSGTVKLVRQLNEVGHVCEILLSTRVGHDWGEQAATAGLKFELAGKYSILTIPSSTWDRIQVAVLPL